MAQRDYEVQPEAPDLGATVQLETAESLVGPPDTDAIEGQDVGVDGGAASAEEAAVHVVDLGTDPEV